MASLKRDIVFRFLGDASKLQAAARQAEGALTGVSTKMQNAGAKLSSWGTSMTRTVSLPLIAAGGAAIKFAIDTEESLNKVNVIFGDQGAVIDRWSKGLADNFRVSRRQALGAVGEFGNLFVTMGFGQEEAAGMSQRMVELAGDLSSFHNIPVDQALEKLRAGLVGEAEPLRVLGVQLTAAKVEAKAMEMGLVDLEGNVTEAGKASARYALIMEETAIAHGDAANTAETAAGQIAIAKANLDDAFSGLGEAALPIFTEVITKITDIVSGFADMDDWAQEWLVGGAAGAVVAGPIARGLGGILSLLGQIARHPGLAALLGLAALSGAAYVSYTSENGLKVFGKQLTPGEADRNREDHVRFNNLTGEYEFYTKSEWEDFMGSTAGRAGGGGPRQHYFGPLANDPWGGPLPSYVPALGSVNINVTDWRIHDPNISRQIGDTVMDVMTSKGMSTASTVTSRYQARAN